jgi:hypothetical protein
MKENGMNTKLEYLAEMADVCDPLRKTIERLMDSNLHGSALMEEVSKARAVTYAAETQIKSAVASAALIRMTGNQENDITPVLRMVN